MTAIFQWLFSSGYFSVDIFQWLVSSGYFLTALLSEASGGLYHLAIRESMET